MSNQIQCPNCGGYNVERPLQRSTGAGIFHLIMFFVTVGFWLIVVWFLNAIENSRPLAKGDHLVCRLCNFEWRYDPDAKPVVTKSPQIERSGTSPDSSTEVVELLKKLSELKESGVISTAEYEDKKMKLLNRL